MKINFKINNLELRSCDSHLADFEKHTTCEIVKYFNEDSCYTIGYWEVNDEGHDFMFCGRRFLECPEKDLFRLIKVGQDYLDEQFSLKEEMNESIS